MQRYFMELSFKGTNYHGWQKQPNAPTVQEVLEEKLSTFFRTKIEIVGAGRTDAGVHASFFVAHFDLDKLPFSNEDTVEKLNRFLPNDIAIQKIRSVQMEAHARFSATKRTYQYVVSRVKDPFANEISYRYLFSLDIESMNKAALLLVDNGDFTSFSKLHSDNETNICQIYEAFWETKGNQLVFTISANRFLRDMVRAIVGTLLEAGRGKLTIDDMKRIIADKNRNSAGSSAPAEGLFLVNVEYPGEVYL